MPVWLPQFTNFSKKLPDDLMVVANANAYNQLEN